MEFSKSKQRNNYSPKLHANFKYQSDCDKDKFQNNCNKYGGVHWVQFARMLGMIMYTNYIKDPFNNNMTMNYLNKTLPCFKKRPIQKWSSSTTIGYFL
jgi:hypothetical protein